MEGGVRGNLFVVDEEAGCGLAGLGAGVFALAMGFAGEGAG